MAEISNPNNSSTVSPQAAGTRKQALQLRREHAYCRLTVSLLYASYHYSYHSVDSLLMISGIGIFRAELRIGYAVALLI